MKPTTPRTLYLPRAPKNARPYRQTIHAEHGQPPHPLCKGEPYAEPDNGQAVFLVAACGPRALILLPGRGFTWMEFSELTAREPK